jgi:hypothetical protein
MLSCTKCWSLLPAYAVGEASSHACPACGASFEIVVFPAMLKGTGAIAPGDLQLTEDSASCFHHASKRAQSACSQCGKFLCALCSLEFGSEVWCSACISAGAGKQTVRKAEQRRTLWDSIALGLIVLPTVLFFFFYFWIFTASAAIFIALKNWNQPPSLLPRTKIRLVLAIVLGLLQIVAWLAMAATVIGIFRAQKS